MKTITIKSIAMQNFKGVRNKVLIDFENNNVNLIGANGTGKTTIFDAFTWALFGQDSLGRNETNKDFEIKPKDKTTNKVINNLDVFVELTLNVDNDLVILKRVLVEKWTKKRGSELAEFGGNETSYYVNGVPKLKKAYEEFIKEFVLDEERFKILTDIRAFSSLKPLEQRAILERLTTKSEQDIVNETPELKELKDELILGRTVEDVLKINQQEQRRINKELESIPNTINALLDTEYSKLDNDFDIEANDKKLDESFKKLSKLEQEVVAGVNQEKLNEYAEAIRSLENDIAKTEREIETEKQVIQDNRRSKIISLKDKITSNNSQINTTYDYLNMIELLENDNKELRLEVDKIKVETFTGDKCSCCGQDLPKDKLDEALETFNLHKSTRLEKIVASGKKNNETIKEYREKHNQFEMLKAETLETNKALQLEIDALEKDNSLTNAKITELETKITKYQDRLEVMNKVYNKEKNANNSLAITTARDEVKNEIEYLSERKAEYNIKLSNEKRVEELRNEIRELNNAYERSAFIIKLCNDFRKIRAKSIDEEVNKHFSIIKFELSRTLVNGTIENICEPIYNGTYFGSASNGEKINIGLDIINTLQELYEVKAPIFIDNAEAVSHWLVEPTTQLIKMFVDESVETLEIEIE